jgi:calpain-7
MVIDEKTPRKLTLVVSQYEKSATIHYSLRVYSTLPFKLNKILDPFKYKKELKGEWKGSSAGGCPNYPETYSSNPKFQLKLDANSRVLIELKGPKQYQVGFDVITVSVFNSESPLYFRKKQSGPYRSGFVVLELELLAGMYNVIPTTFKPGQESPFFISVRSSSEITLGRL